MTESSKHWFTNGVLYQIYPRSFKDSNGDGIGDFAGITQQLDYLKGTPESLGVTAIWLSPFYPSPMADFGYDVADYCNVDPVYGTLADFTHLLKEAHARGIRVIIDLVPNHSSDEHPWFVESKSSRDSPKRDWYVWKDLKPDGSPPNNWLGHFGGTAWEYDDSTGQAYLHSFLAKQPDLNWDNPEVREAMREIVRFWLDLGVDGFRVDWVAAISKDPEFTDNPINPDFEEGDDPYHAVHPRNSEMGPNLYEYLNEIAEVLATYEDKFMVTEVYPNKIKKPGPYMKFYERIDPLVCAPLNFAMMFMPWNAEKFRKFIDRYQNSMKPGYVPVYSTGNHDNSRLVTRLGSKQARTAAMMVMTLPGAPLVYYGDEIGMTDVAIPANEVQDPFEKNVPGKGLGRDPERTPMQWDDSANAGFTDENSTPWLRVADDYAHNNVDVQQSDQNSMFALYQKLIAKRMKHPSLRRGDYESFDVDQPEVLAYSRTLKGRQGYGMLLNFSGESLNVIVPNSLQGIINISTDPRKKAEKIRDSVTLSPFEGIVIALD